MRHDKQTEPFYSSRAWRMARAEALRRDDGECQLCLREGRWALSRTGRQVPVRATMVHHIVPYKQAPERACDLENLVSLCDACHERMHPERHGGAREGDEAPLAIASGVRVVTIPAEDEGG